MSLHTDDADIDIGEKFDELYRLSEEKEPEICEAWTISDVLELIGFSYNKGNFTSISDGSYGYYIILCTDLDSLVERCLQKVGFEKQDCEDIWVRNTGTDQLSQSKLAGIIKILIEHLIDELGYKYNRLHQICLRIEEDLAPPLTSNAYALSSYLRKSSFEDRKLPEFLSVLYRGICEPLRDNTIVTESSRSLITDIRRFRHHFSGHDPEIQHKPDKTPHKEIEDVEKRLKNYTKNTSFMQEIDVLIFKYNLLKSLDACFADICDKLEEKSV